MRISANIHIRLDIDVRLDDADLDGLATRVLERAEELRRPVQAAMAGEYVETVRGNFGDWGVDRPATWPPLSPAYARKVGREHATLYVSGALFSAVRCDPEAGVVSVANADVPYATVHQYGGGNNIPARPYFPIQDDGSPTEGVERRVQEAAQRAADAEGRG